MVSRPTWFDLKDKSGLEIDLKYWKCPEAPGNFYFQTFPVHTDSRFHSYLPPYGRGHSRKFSEIVISKLSFRHGGFRELPWEHLLLLSAILHDLPTPLVDKSSKSFPTRTRNRKGEANITLTLSPTLSLHATPDPLFVRPAATKE